MNQPPSNGQPNGSQKSGSILLSSNGNQPQPEENDQEVLRTEAFDQPVILQQPSTWSRAIMWSIVGVALFTIGWAAIAKVDEAVPAVGKLEPSGAVQEVEAPISGVVTEVLVHDGDHVDKGDVLIRLDTTASAAQLASLQEVRASLELENQFYRSQLSGQPPSPEALQQLQLSPETLALTQNRSALLAENNLYYTLLSGGSPDGTSLDVEESFRLQALQSEVQSRIAAAQLEIAQLDRQLSQNAAQLEGAQETLRINQSILDDVTPLVEEGGIARLQYTNQELQVLSSQTDVNSLQEERQRLQYAIAQAQQQLQNTISLSQSDLLGRVADNQKRIAEIDSQLNKTIVENEKQIAELDSQISQAQLNIQYQEITAPMDGIVFDLKAQEQSVVGNTADPVLKIVPGDSLVARVYITNRDIGFVSEGMDVDVRIDSFPFSEFGDIEGKLVWIGSDALPPDEIRREYTFPAKIELDSQALQVNGRDINLQSGMSVSVNIITRKRTVLSIFLDMFRSKIDSLTTSR
jgi:HlyD family secretion protein